MPQKVALITGCNSGIGHALALEFAAKGVKVFATARNPDTLSSLVAQHPKSITAFQLDVTSAPSIASLRSQVEQLTASKLDYLVNNAGAHYSGTGLGGEIESEKAIFDVNVFGVMSMCRAFGPMVIAAKGTIVQIGSVSRFVPMPYQGAYNASKAALNLYTNTLRLELQPLGVHVSEIVTGIVITDILNKGGQAPHDELYAPVKKHIDDFWANEVKGAVHVDAYARRVVRQILKSSPPKEFWDGKDASLLKFVEAYVPMWIRDIIYYHTFGLKKLKGNAR